ncbi:MAG: TonB-dependent receptor domain-containing protein [Halothece sp.]
MNLIGNPLLKYALISITPVLVASAVQAQTEPLNITDIQLNSTADESLQLLLFSPDSDQIEASSTEIGENTLVVEVPNAQLQLPQRESIRWSDPSVEITEISVVQQSPDTVQITVRGATAVPNINVGSVPEGFAINFPEQGSLAETTPDNEPTSAATPEDEVIELVVTATRTEEEATDIPRSTTVINREEIEQQSQLSNNLPDILGNTVPGLGPPSQSASNRAQRLRGREPSVLIDGVPVDSNLSIFQDLRSISPDAVEQVEVVRGASSTFGAEAGGGIINIITRQPEDEPFIARTKFKLGPRLSLSNFEESFGAGVEQFFSGRLGDFDYLFATSFEGTGNTFDAEGDLIPVGRSQGLDNLETFNILGKAGVDITPDQRLQLTVNYFDDKQDPPTLSDPSVDDIEERVKARPLDVSNEFDIENLPGREDLTLSLNYSHENLLNSEFNAQVFYKESTTLTIPEDNRNTIFQSVSRTITDSEKFGIRLDANTPLNNNLDLLWGADYSDESIEQPLEIFNARVFEESGGTRFEKIEEAFFSPPFDLESIGLFSQLTWEANDQLSLTGGLRFERFEMSVDDFNVLGGIDFRGGAVPDGVTGGEVNFDDIVFNMGAVYDLSEEVNVFANFSQGFSAPDFRRFLRFLPEFVSPPAQVNEDIDINEPIIVDNYEIGIRGNWDQVQASLVGFFTWSELGQNERASEDGSFLASSREPTRTYGIEATADYQMNDNWEFGGNFTWVEGDSSPEDVDGFIPLNTVNVQPIKIGLYVQNQTTPTWSNRLQALIVGDRDRAFEEEVNDNTVDPFPIEGYTTVDWISNLQLTEDSNLTLTVQNLFDNQFFPVDSQTQRVNRQFAAGLGRTVSLQYQISW